ncbi:MAG: hypothetical protein ACYC77_07195 [Coriobacteriia bacterium]
MTPDSTPGTSAIGRLERTWMYLVYGGPVSWWVPMARIVGVKVDRDVTVDDTVLAHAEEGAATAARLFGPGLTATTVGVIALLVLLPSQLKFVGPFLEFEFDVVSHYTELAGVPYWLQMTAASAGPMLTSLAVGILNAVIFGGIPLFFLRRCTVAAAPAVSIALAQGDDATHGAQALAYPRVALAARSILHPRRWLPRP